MYTRTHTIANPHTPDTRTQRHLFCKSNFVRFVLAFEIMIFRSSLPFTIALTYMCTEFSSECNSIALSAREVNRKRSGGRPKKTSPPAARDTPDPCHPTPSSIGGPRQDGGQARTRACGSPSLHACYLPPSPPLSHFLFLPQALSL